jgi:low affinity Fe/Cu permease
MFPWGDVWALTENIASASIAITNTILFATLLPGDMIRTLMPTAYNEQMSAMQTFLPYDILHTAHSYAHLSNGTNSVFHG